MKCYILAFRCLRTKCCITFILFIAIFILGRVFQHRRTILFSSMFRQGAGDPRGSLEQFLKENTSNNKRFIPGLFLRDFKPQNVSFCKFRFSLPESLDIPEWDVQYSPELGINSGYRVVYNVVQSSVSSEYSKSNITFCTHATPEFFYYVVEILYRWEGPISVAAFVPNSDATLVMCLVQRLCSCVPQMSRMSLHFVFPFKYPPEISSCPSSLITPNTCMPPNALMNGPLETFRNVVGLTYPINVARNVARIKTDTTFILVSDIELLPSRNLVTNFIKMLEKLEKENSLNSKTFTNNIVFVLPVFEIQPNEQAPMVKSKLLELYSQNQAFYFHRWVCNHCQRFPGLQRWVLRKKPILDNVVEPFFVVRREFPFHRWEPIFIGTNTEPLYSELLSWEGQQDKMTQMHEMCLLRYRFVILDGGFLVHAPGVKRKTDVSKDPWIIKQQKQNSLHYDGIIQRITARHKHNFRCKVH